MSTSHNIAPPPGSIISYLGTTDPDGWIICNGTTRTDNSDSRYNTLFALGIGSGGSGTSNYTPPDLRGTFLFSSYLTNTSLLSSGGATTATLTTANLPVHTHTGTTDSGGGSHTHTATVTDAGHNHGGATVSAGGSHTHTATVTDGGHNHGGSSTTYSGTHNHTATSTDAGHAHTYYSYQDDYNRSAISGQATGAFGEDGAGAVSWTLTTGKAVITTTIANLSVSHSHTITSGTAGITVANASTDISHTHTINSGTTGLTVANASTNIDHTHAFTTGSTGQGTSISILPPYKTVNYIIKY